jgi:hypothetical protein
LIEATFWCSLSSVPENVLPKGWSANLSKPWVKPGSQLAR